jgi:hypothetical protein
LTVNPVTNRVYVSLNNGFVAVVNGSNDTVVTNTVFTANQTANASTLLDINAELFDPDGTCHQRTSMAMGARIWC